MDDLSVVIVNWNTEKLLRQCLKSVFANTKVLKLEVIVIDNASTDHSVTMVQTEFPQVNMIVNCENVGFAKGNNQGMSIAAGRYIVLLNPDTEVTNNALGLMVQFMEQHTSIGALGPKLVLPDGTVQGGGAGYEPSPLSLFNYAFMLHAILPNANALWLSPKHYLASQIEVDWVAGACLIVRKQVVEQVGDMDSGFFMYAEDIEWCHRIKKAGWHVVCLSEVTVIHHIGGSTQQKGVSFISQNIKGLDQYYRTRYGTRQVFLMHFWGMLGFGLRALIYQMRLTLSRNQNYYHPAQIMWQCARSSLHFLLLN